jgi:adenylate cyclase class IV
MAFQNIIRDNGFIETRRKEKDRVAYSLDSIKFDIDTYK